MSLTAEPTSQTADGNFRWLSAEEELAFFDAKAREITGLSGTEFLQRLDAGEFRDIVDDLDHSGIMYLALLSHIVR